MIDAKSSILITGAASDIGLRLIERLQQSASGEPIIAQVHRGADRLAQFAGKLDVITSDLSTADGVRHLLDRIAACGAQPGKFVHLPALPMVYERVNKIDLQRFDRDMRVQVGSLLEVLGAILPGMAERSAPPGAARAKVVVVSSSVVSGAPPKYTTAYTAVKYAQLGLTRSMAAEFGPKGVNINIVAPSMVATRFLAEIPAKAVEMAAAQHPMQRNATVDDLLPAIEFLLSSGSDFMSGATIPVSGGSTM